MRSTSVIFFHAALTALVFWKWPLKYPGSTRFKPWDLDSSMRLCSYTCIRPYSLRYGLRLSGIRCLNVISYLPWEFMWPSKTWKILHVIYNAGIRSQLGIIYISYNIFLMFTLQGPDLDHAAGWSMLRRAALLGHHFVGTDRSAWFRHGFGSSFHTRELGVTRHSACPRRLV
jgi:hypothetical protein